jgi:pimeloyl-ACP methyl ester carboxylesterase
VSAAIGEHTIEVWETSTRYFAAGSGPPLVLLHGDGESAFDWS